jgi:hypothetical protein
MTSASLAVYHALNTSSFDHRQNLKPELLRMLARPQAAHLVQELVYPPRGCIHRLLVPGRADFCCEKRLTNVVCFRHCNGKSIGKSGRC